MAGILFPNNVIRDENKWKIDGLTDDKPHAYDIIGILEPHELYFLDNYKMLKEAKFYSERYLVSASNIEKPARVIKRNDDGTFTLDFGKYTKDMRASDFKDLKVIEKRTLE